MTVRVVQWGSGNVGTMAMRAVASRPDMDLVGLLVNTPDKVGRDLGEVARLEPLGIAATDDIDEIVAMDADVVVHMPLPSLVYGDDPDADLRNFVRLLEAGKHVITTVGYMYPAVYGDEVMGPLSAACRAGRSVFHGTGANPGWFGDVLPLLLSGLSLRIDEIHVHEISSFMHYPSPQIMFDMMNFGKTPDEFEAHSVRHRRWIDGLFTEAVQMVARGLDVESDRTTTALETWVTPVDLETAAGTVRAGTVAGQRYRWEAMVDDRPFVTQETVWRMHDDVAPEWPHGDWSITISGQPRMQVSLPEGWNSNVLGATAAHAINAIPYVMEADPGVRTLLDLPMIVGRGATRRLV